MTSADVVGNEPARAALLAAIDDPVRHAALYAAYGRRPGKGVLLHGPPGNGKTMFARMAATMLHQQAAAAVGAAGEERPSMLLVNGPAIQSVWVGQTEATIRAIFAYARAYRRLYGLPLTVFIDEADAILPSRDGHHVPWFQASNVATFLAEMDGLEGSDAFVILATNRPQAIDAAILRDGRIDRKIRVERPDRAAARQILARRLAGVPLQPGAQPEALAEAAIADLLQPWRGLAELAFDGGTRLLTLADIVSGALIAGLVDRAREFAFARDAAAGAASPSGVGLADFVAAIDQAVADNRALAHPEAAMDVARRENLGNLTMTPLKPPAVGP